MRTASLVALAVLAACSESPEKPTAERVPEPPETGRPAPQPAPVAPVVAPASAAPTVPLPGEYRVAGVNGSDINQPYAITASIGRDRIHVTADCLNFAWRYTQSGDALETRRVPVESCARGLTKPEEAVVAAFDAATAVGRTPANGIELRAPGHTVTLFSQ